MDINGIIAEYLREKAAADAAKKRADALRARILDACGSAGHMVTDEFVVTVRETESTRIDTAALYRDFPDAKDVYGKRTVSRSVVVAVIADTVKSA